MDLGPLSAALEVERKARETLQERLAALEPMRDEFIAEKMHTDSEIQTLKQKQQDLSKKVQVKSLESQLYSIFFVGTILGR